MRDGWFLQDGLQVEQQMWTPRREGDVNVKTPKGIKLVLEERGLWRAKLKLKCGSKKADCTSEECCASESLSLLFLLWQPLIRLCLSHTARFSARL